MFKRKSKTSKSSKISSKSTKNTLKKSKSNEPENIIDNYNLNKILGRGSFGVVYKATHKKTGEERAIKDIFISQMEIKIVETEIEILKLMGCHPNIMCYVESQYNGLKVSYQFQQKYNFLIVTEYIPGDDLDVFIKSTKRNYIEENLFFKLANGITNGVKHLHSVGIAHLDIKPENIMYNDEQPKLIDFGFSCEFNKDFIKKSSKTGCSKSIRGTPNFVSPEYLSSLRRVEESIINNDNKSSIYKAIDAWALGVTLYVLANKGRVPFRYKTVNMLYNAIKNIQPSPSEHPNENIQNFFKDVDFLNKNWKTRSTIEDISKKISRYNNKSKSKSPPKSPFKSKSLSKYKSLSKSLSKSKSKSLSKSLSKSKSKSLSKSLSKSKSKKTRVREAIV
jgi:serine/threonine protein kinase